jgi:ATP-binding cassette subfamily B protein
MSFGQGGPMGMMRGMAKDQSVLRARLEQGTTRRVLGYARPFVRSIVAFLTIVILDAGIVVAVPLLLRDLVDLGVIPKAPDVVDLLCWSQSWPWPTRSSHRPATVLLADR